MEKEEGRFYPVSALRICIDECDGDIKGRIYSKLSERAIPFGNMGEMLLQADELFDECGYPQAFQEKRNFGEAKSAVGHARPKAVLGDHEIRQQAGKRGTVNILVKSRRKTGWQGYIFDDDGKRTGVFQSEMELLRCLSIKNIEA